MKTLLALAAFLAQDKQEVRPFEYVDAVVPNYVGSHKLGQPLRKMQLPVEAAESIKHIKVPAGFEVRLFASDPDIVKPLCMAWDERGRLWIAESVDYPNELKSEGLGRDRIRILEDADGDGRADKFTLFADKLSIPTSIVFARGGIILAQAPHTLFLRDTDGDDRADERRILFSGWGTGDTHAGPSNLRWGFDNWIWGCVGYSGFNGKVGGRDHKFSQGFYRFRPDGTELEFLTSTSNNTWGFSFSETGHVFGSTANNQHAWYLAIPNRHFEAVRGWHGRGSMGIEDHKKFHPVTEHVRQVDAHGGFTAAAGSAIYTARNFPREYWNRAAFVAEPTGHLLHKCWFEPPPSRPRWVPTGRSG